MPSNDFGQLHGQRCLVTGSSTGIGKAIAQEFLRAGATCILHGRSNSDQLSKSRDHLRSMPDVSSEQVMCLTADLSDTTGCESLVDQAWKQLGKIDIWVNNAGVDLLTGEAAKLDYVAKLQKLLDVDVRSTAVLSRLVASRMQSQGSGVILNIGWDQADRGMDGESAELFSVAKNAIMGLTRSLALSYAPAVRVNCIAPGWIKTSWGETASVVWQERVLRETPLRRWGLPEDIARLARFLCSEEASYITGQVINCNGGAVR